jgi:hypothetical protein
MNRRGGEHDAGAGRGDKRECGFGRHWRCRCRILAVAEGSIQLQAFLHHAHWNVTSGAAHSFLLALALLSIVGIRYPLGMLPLLIYELLWKMIWLCGYALPLWAANQVDADTRKSFFEIAPVVILFPLLPWRYIFSKYLKKPGDRWR